MIDEIISRLDRVRKSGKGYTALCPVHDDSSPSMTVTEKDGKVLCHCFSCGANGYDVIKALGLPASVLFEQEYVVDRTIPSQKEMDAYIEDLFCLEMKESVNSYTDFKRLRLAEVRSKRFEERYGEVYKRS